jgi:hypothetical protein
MAERERADRTARGPLVPPRPVAYDDRGDGWTLAAELVTATFVWGGIGWLGDRLLGTAPVLMAVGFVLGNALGVYLIWLRSQARFEREHADLIARRRRPDPSTADGGGASDAAPEAAPPGGRPAARDADSASASRAPAKAPRPGPHTPRGGRDG